MSDRWKDIIAKEFGDKAPVTMINAAIADGLENLTQQIKELNELLLSKKK